MKANRRTIRKPRNISQCSPAVTCNTSNRHQGCKYAYMPKSNIEFWKKKFQDNIERDVEVKSELGKVGIKEVIIWECTIKEMKENERRKVCCLRKIKRFMNEGKIYLEI